MAQKGIHWIVKNKHLVNYYNLYMLDKSVVLTNTYLHFCSHLAARKRLDALAGDFCPHLAAKNRLDAPAGDTVDQSVVFSQTIGFPSLGCKTHYFSEWVRLWWWLFHGGTERNGTKA